MPQSETHTVIVNTINRSFGAWDKVRSKLPPNADEDADMDNAARARWAFLEHLPVLHDPQSFQVYVACIAHGVTLGAVQVAEIGRYGHLVQLAMSTWKLANPDWKNPQKQDPLPTKGNHSEASGAQGLDSQTRDRDHSAAKTPDQPAAEPKNTHPLPTKGNHSEGEGAPETALSLPNACPEQAEGSSSSSGTGEGSRLNGQPTQKPPLGAETAQEPWHEPVQTA